jgi:hypothetical protein
LTKDERQDLDLRVYFANTAPKEHPLWNSWLLKLVDDSTFPGDVTTSDQFQELATLEKGGNLGQKIALDFAYALRYALDTSSARYVAIFEGDVLFANGWLARSIIALQDIDRRVGGNRNAWLDMRLFNEERNIGFSSHSIFGNNVPLIILGFSFTIFCALLAIRKYTATGKKFITISFFFVICFITIPLTIIVFFQAGKSSVLPPSPGVKLQQWGCCTQGIILPREQVLGLASELVQQASQPPDVIVGDYAREQGFLRFALDPVQLQHMGRSSSRKAC